MLTNAEYFVGAFLSTIIAVLFAIPWVIIDARVRSLEPFHQCAKAQGASASKTIYMNYNKPFFLLAPVKALFSGHWAPFVTSILSNATILVTALAPEFVFVRLEGSCDSLHTGCIPSLSVFPLAGRMLEAFLGFMAIWIIVLIAIMSRYHTGVFSEPHSIAGLAVLFNNQEVRNDFREATLAMSGTKKIVHKLLAPRNYRLDYYREVDGSINYGLAPGIPQSYQNPPGPRWNTIHIHEFQPAQPLPTSYPHRKFALGLIAILSGLMIVIVYYKLVYNPNSGFEKFMDSQGFGVRFLFTFVGVMISRFWASIFKGEIVPPYSANQPINLMPFFKTSLLCKHSATSITAQQKHETQSFSPSFSTPLPRSCQRSFEATSLPSS